MRELTGYPSIDQVHKHEESFFEKHPIIPDINIYGALCFLSRTYRNDIAINCNGFNTTYSYLLKDSTRISYGLAALGVRSGEIIAVCMPNLYQAVAIFFAANRIGITITFLNEYSTCEEICDHLKRFNSPLLINYDREEKFNRELINRTGIKYIITLDKSKREIRFLDEPMERLDTVQPLLHFENLYTIGKKKK